MSSHGTLLYAYLDILMYFGLLSGAICILLIKQIQTQIEITHPNL